MATSLCVANADHYTFRRLLELKDEGYSVMRSPHFTNSGLSTTNLGIAALGFQTVGYDWGWITPGGKQLANNNALWLGKKRLASEPLVSTIEASINVDKISCSGASLSDYHTSMLNAAFSSGNVTTMTSYVQAHSSIFEAVIESALADEATCSDFVNGVDAEGHKLPCYFSRRPEPLGLKDVYGIKSDVNIRAHVPMVGVLASLFAMQANDSGKNIIYHLAGSEMTKYIDSYRQGIVRILAKLACDGLIDTNLEVVIVPTSGTLVIAKNSTKEDLEFMFLCVKQFQEGGQAKREAAKAFENRLRAFTKNNKNPSVSVLDATCHGGEGISVLDSTLDISITQLMRRARRVIDL